MFNLKKKMKDFLKLVFQLIEALSISSLTLGKFIDFLRGKFRSVYALFS